jgi:hypothetical protein
MKHILFVLLPLFTITTNAQVGIGTTTPNASAQLDVTSTTQGFLPPRLALTGTTDITTIKNTAGTSVTPATGLFVYNTATAGISPNNVTPGLYYYDGSKWQRIINQQPDATVEFNQVTPTTAGVVFTPNTPASKDYIYVSTINNSQWTYNGTAYVTYTPPASTAWNLAGGTTDAGSNKTGDIVRSGKVGIGTTTPNASAQLDVTSTNKGFLPPRVTLTGTSDITTIASPATGLIVYNTATAGDVTPGLYYYNGSSWQRINTPNSTSPSIPVWNSLTPSITATTTNPTFNTDRLSLNWRMIGPKEMECVFVINTTTAGNNGSGDYLLPVPGGYSIDNSLNFQKAYTGGVGASDQYGFWRYGLPGGVGRWSTSTGSGGWDVIPVVYDANRIRLLIFSYGGFVRCWGSNAIGSSASTAITVRYTLQVL